MPDQWDVAEGTGWIAIPGFGQINPRRDSGGGGSQYFNAMLEDGTHARVIGEDITGGPEVFFFEFDQPFFLADREDRCIKVEISLLIGGRYAVKYRQAAWPTPDRLPWQHESD